MRVRFWLILGLLLLLTLPASIVLADNGPHGNYTATTDACAGCHRAHTAVGPKLLVNAVPALCYTCHGTAGAGADTNVEDGIYLERDGVTEPTSEGIVNRGLKAGGFANALMDTSWSGAASSRPTTSSHIADGSAGIVWGNGLIGSGAGITGFNLSCTSCHDPHGGASTIGGATYRLLRAVPVNSNAGTGVDIPDEPSKNYTLSDTVDKSGNQYFGEGWDYFGRPWGSMDLPEQSMSEWCKQCHTRYEATSGSGHTDSGDPIFAYRHQTDGVATTCSLCHTNPPSAATVITTVGPMFSHFTECITCHVAHGTAANMVGYAGTVEWPDATTTPNGANRSSLLRLDNRGVCQGCHGK